MKEHIVTTTIKFLTSLLALILLLAQMPTAALPALAGSNAALAPRTQDPRAVVAEGFEQLIGRELTNREMRQVNQAIDQLNTLEESRVQTVGMAADVIDTWNRYEKLPVLCFYGKLSAKLPFSTKKLSLNGAAASYERTPCLVLNTFNPLGWRLDEFRSYVMQGGSMAANPNQYGGAAVGVMAGIYAGPKSLARPLIGTYGFVRVTGDKGLAKLSGQVAYSNNGQILAMVGIGGELSIDAILRAVNVMPKVDPNSVSVGGAKVDVGMYFDVKEFPWFQRMVLQGVNPVDAFADINTYIASN